VVINFFFNEKANYPIDMILNFLPKTLKAVPVYHTTFTSFIRLLQQKISPENKTI
jgi:hypothetical protein